MKNVATGRLMCLVLSLLVLCVPGVARAQLTFNGNAAKFNLVPIVTLQGAQAIVLGGALSDGFNTGLVQTC